VDGQDVEEMADVQRPEGATCTPGATQCVGNNFLKCNTHGMDWTVVVCDRGTTCTSSGCLETTCSPNTPACDDEGRMVVCLPDGSAFSAPIECPEGYLCQAGQCLPAICTPGTMECSQTSILICDGDPPTWREQPCSEGEICFKGDCVDCFTDSQCPSPLVCTEGHCSALPLTILTEELPDGQVEATYSAALSAAGGNPGYTWSIAGGSLPQGLTMNAGTGGISGTPTVKGVFSLTFAVTDDAGFRVERELPLTIHDKGLAITSRSPLPDAEEGTPYQFAFKAIGGTPPYGWMLTSGKLPLGLTMTSEGTLTGTPTEHGTFEFTVRVVDVGDPLSVAQAPFRLTVKIAPLVIIGDQMLDLFLTKAVVLQLITVVEGIPIPYSTKLQAKGGVKPYTWKEIEMPSFVKMFIPKAGLPSGLSLASNGTLSGSVTSTADVFELNVPFINLKLTGFFFMGEVRDSQSPADSDNAIFLIPTLPVNLGGGGLPF
jgi:hypothetical protein